MCSVEGIPSLHRIPHKLTDSYSTALWKGKIVLAISIFIFLCYIHINISLQNSCLLSLFSLLFPFLPLSYSLFLLCPPHQKKKKLKGKNPSFKFIVGHNLALFYLRSPLLQEIIYLNYMVCPHGVWQGGWGWACCFLDH